MCDDVLIRSVVFMMRTTIVRRSVVLNRSLIDKVTTLRPPTGSYERRTCLAVVVPTLWQLMRHWQSSLNAWL